MLTPVDEVGGSNPLAPAENHKKTALSLETILR